MSSMEIDRLIQEHSLVPESFEDTQLAHYWAKAATSFADAQAAGLSSFGALHLAYMAALRTNVALLAVHGLRVSTIGDDHTAFHAAENLDGVMGRHAAKLDAIRLAGDQLMYEPEYEEEQITKQFGRAMTTLREALPALRSAILAVRPGLAAALPVTE